MSTGSDSVDGHKGYRDRRWRAILVVLLVWFSVSLWHWQPETRWLMVALTAILTLQTLRMVFTKPTTPGNPQRDPYPIVSVVVPARNEEAAIGPLVNDLRHLDYPVTHLDIWIVDDGSTDGTPGLLRHLQTQFPDLQVYRHPSTGRKAAALNAVLPHLRGEIVLVCDADAQVPAHFLRETVPWFQWGNIGAVQARKVIANARTNFWTRCQHMEMNGDAFLQIHRLAVKGMSELRGNGMLVRREVLAQWQGWNEETVTEDLDFTFRLYLTRLEIAFVTTIAIQEEGVTHWRSLWQQRCRWAEGGYQRYLDYFPQILTLGWEKAIDLLLFFLLQFLVPIGLIPDLLWALFYDHQPVLLPLQILLSVILNLALIAGLYQFQGVRGWKLLWPMVQGSVFMLHWIPVMVVVPLRLCFQRHPSVWVKTDHQGRLA